MSGQVEQPSVPTEGAGAAAVKHPSNCRCIKPRPVTEAGGEDGGRTYEARVMSSAYPVRAARVPSENAVSIDIYERNGWTAEDREGPATIVIPSKVVIDGQPVYLPADSQINVKAGRCASEVTLTLFARRVRVGFEDELDGPVGVPAGQTTPEADA
ncbi:hypothetical protein ACFOY2_45840 [Nonomuraea purpurea]|uniref:Uncharacterized protein n=1 Tax=Nonomuraea purpurea TaxID=1849276 RepID=A0ABV8GNU0_9ACTN